MANDFEKLENLIEGCKKCTRLVSFRKKIAREKRKQYLNEKYWGCLLYTSDAADE